MAAPAEALQGIRLPGGWTVVERVDRGKGTGGTFSTGYFVEHDDGRRAFLKAMDYTWAFDGEPEETADRLNWLTQLYIFERSICLRCRQNKITRVVHAIEHGSLPGTLGPSSHIEYLIFERADGDVRAFLDKMDAFDIAFVLRTLHSTTVAVKQLHAAQMAHQDLKPSNVLIFNPDGTSKLGDLGRAWAKDIVAPHDKLPFAGDRSYAPPEIFYGVMLPEDAQRFGIDLYLLGSLVVFLFTRASMTALLIKHLRDIQSPHLEASYAEALPYIKVAFANALKEFESHVPSWLRARLVPIMAELCDPDYTTRGNPTLSSQRRYSLERYISAFDYLSARAELRLKLGQP